MACHEAVLTGDVHRLIAHLEDEILRGSISATREEASEQTLGDALLVVRTYERYSAMGGNRVSLNVAVMAVADQLAVTMTAAGGSEAMFFKINTFGEEAFLQKAVDALAGFGRGERRSGGSDLIG
ncbi:MAG: DUF6054 family protein [Nocardioides sp.]|jgi:hypothetical protein|uniref:DUF6054 family protein n=1 Tax=Nocardioides nematodiphilus TaxID=2849669 RepID=UPI001CD9ECFF|nr:DUF6054 family protein [Nocardioides nematodiphilus]MCA1981930.1 DUF6054 family protein [Nocardioides nematodiphilus]